MLKTLTIAAAVATVIGVMAPSTGEAAVANPGQAIASHKGAAVPARYVGGGHYGGGHYGYRGGYRGYGYGYGFVPGVYLYSGPTYYSYGPSRCEWLHHKARATGSRYWWNRYRYECF